MPSRRIRLTPSETGFEDDVRHMIRKQIDFIYIQNATVRGCEQSG